MAILIPLLILSVGAALLLAELCILRPVFLAGKGSTSPTRYGVGDLICLMVYLSIAATLVRLARFELVSQTQEWALMAAACLFVIATWWLGVRSLCRAGINDWLRHVVYLCVAVPLAYGGLAAIGPATLLLFFAIMDSEVAAGVVGPLPIWLGIYALLVLALVVARHIAGWICPTPATPTSDPEEG